MTGENRAYSTFEVKAIDAEKRLIQGIASTPEPDRMNDVVVQEGIEFKLPLPLLYQHVAAMPIGQVIKAKVTDEGLNITAQISPDIPEAPFINQAWALIKAGLVRGFSIGFRSLEEAWDKTRGGVNFLKTEVLEISAVTIPANAEANILTVKSADLVTLAAFRAEANQKPGAVFINVPGVSGLTTAKGITVAKPTVLEQITQFEAKRAANAARKTELMQKSFDEGRTLTAAESEEYDGLEADITEIDKHLVRLRKEEREMLARAQPVPSPSTPNVQPFVARSVQPVQVKPRAEKGIGMARMAMALIKAQGNYYAAAEIAHHQWPEMPELELFIKASVEAGDTTTSGWASQLVPAARALPDEFLELLRPATIVGRIPGLRRVPFNVAIPVQTGGGTYGWVGEAAAKPVTSLVFGSVTLRWAKAAGIIVITEELARQSVPSAEMIVRDEMIAGIAQFLDTQFVSTTAEVANLSPAGILNTITPVPASGTTAAAFRTDFNNMLNNFAANNVNPSNLVILMSATTAIALSLMVTDLGVSLFPNISVSGGSIFGMPVIVSEAVGNKIIALNTRDILLAEDGGVRLDVSREASVEMSTTPIVGDVSPFTGAVLKSLWQNNLVGLRVEQWITWKAGRTNAVEYINNVAYVP